MVCRAANAACDRIQKSAVFFLGDTIHLHQFVVLRRQCYEWQHRATEKVNNSCLLSFGRHSISYFDSSVFSETSTEKLVARSEEQRRDTVLNFPTFNFQIFFLKRPSSGILTLFQKECIERLTESRSLGLQHGQRDMRTLANSERKDQNVHHFF